jgi:hypothetical protein
MAFGLPDRNPTQTKTRVSESQTTKIKGEVNRESLTSSVGVADSDHRAKISCLKTNQFCLFGKTPSEPPLKSRGFRFTIPARLARMASRPSQRTSGTIARAFASQRSDRTHAAAKQEVPRATPMAGARNQ